MTRAGGLLALLLACLWCAAPGAAQAGGGALTTPQLCARMRAASGPLRLPAHRHSLRILATGDSMIYPIDEELSITRPARRERVRQPPRRDRPDDERGRLERLSAHQAAALRPDVTVITLGGRDGGISLPDAHGGLVACCGPQWLALYAARVRPLVSAYVRGGRGRVYWLALPAPREALRAPLFEAVNNALALLVPGFHGALRLIPTAAVDLAGRLPVDDLL